MNLSGDGNQLDAVIICKHSIYPTAHIKCRIIGGLVTSDENGMDEKILLVPDIKIDPFNRHINSYMDLDTHTPDETKYFFEHYKDLEPNKFVKIDKFINQSEALEVYKKSILYE